MMATKISMLFRRTWWMVLLGDWTVMFGLVMAIYWPTVPFEIITMIMIIWIVVVIVPTIIYD